MDNRLPYDRGVSDYFAGKLIDDNPFVIGTRDSDRWVDGFLHAQDNMYEEEFYDDPDLPYDYPDYPDYRRY